MPDSYIEKYRLKSNSFYDFLLPEEAEYIKKNLSRKEFSKNEILFREHSFSKGVFIVRKGKVKIFQTSGEGKDSLVYIYKKGEFFGYRPLLAEEPHPVSAMALDDVVVSFIPDDVFLHVFNQSPVLAKRLLINLNKESSVWISKLTTFSQKPVKTRVALSLLILQNIYQLGEGKPNSAIIKIGRDDFAGFVGTAKETLVRMLRVFKDENIISSKGTKIKILNQKALIEMVSDL